MLINLVISFYSSSIFLNAGYNETQALYASLGYGAVQVVFTIPTLFMIDTVGRRRLCLIVSLSSLLIPHFNPLSHPTSWHRFVHSISLPIPSSVKREHIRLMMQTFPLMCIFLLAAGLSLLNKTGSQASQVGPVVLFVYLFTIMYSFGEGPVAFQYSAEVFPTIQREQGMAWAVFINNFFGMSFLFPATPLPSA